VNDDELWIPTVDVCALCGDSECDGVGCYANLDPNDERDHPRIEQVQDWVRRGRAWEQVDRVLAEAEGRPEVSP
jgi:hypothetical protein